MLKPDETIIFVIIVIVKSLWYVQTFIYPTFITNSSDISFTLETRAFLPDKFECFIIHSGRRIPLHQITLMKKMNIRQSIVFEPRGKRHTKYISVKENGHLKGILETNCEIDFDEDSFQTNHVETFELPECFFSYCSLFVDAILWAFITKRYKYREKYIKKMFSA